MIHLTLCAILALGPTRSKPDEETPLPRTDRPGTADPDTTSAEGTTTQEQDQAIVNDPWRLPDIPIIGVL